LGYNYRGYGNFISYSKRAHLVFKENDKTESLINLQTKRHWNKVQRRLIKPPQKRKDIVKDNMNDRIFNEDTLSFYLLRVISVIQLKTISKLVVLASAINRFG
jgi:hypothetical protein